MLQNKIVNFVTVYKVLFKVAVIVDMKTCIIYNTIEI